MAFKYTGFGSSDQAAFGGGQSDRIDYKAVMFEYPSDQGAYCDFRIMTDPKDSKWNKKISQHPWLRTKTSYVLNSKDPNVKFDKERPDTPGKLRWIGTRRCTNKSKDDRSCEYCNFIGGRLNEIDETLKKLFKDKHKGEEMKIADYRELLKIVTEKAKGNEKAKHLLFLEEEFNNLYTSRSQPITYLSVWVIGKGPRLMEAKSCIKDAVDKLMREKKDVTKQWIRIENNKKKKTKAADYYLIYGSPEFEVGANIKDSHMEDLENSDIAKVYKNYLDEETPEKQLDGLNGIFKVDKPKMQEAVEEEENLSSLEDVFPQLEDPQTSAETDFSDVSNEIDNFFGEEVLS